MDRKLRLVVDGLRVANVTFFVVAVLLFLTAAVHAARPHKSSPRTAVGAAQIAPGGSSSGATSTRVTPPDAPPTTSPGQPVVSPPDRCHTPQLAVTDNGGQDAAGVFFGTMVVRNVSSQPCVLYGFPGLQRRDASGRVLRTTVVRDRRPPTSMITIAPQQPASFGYSTADRPSAACDHATTVDVTPPDETTQLSVSSPLIACRPADVVNVGPLQAGPAATLAGLS